MSLLSQNLLAFINVKELGTVHEAARQLGLTQTGVTQRIRSLEHELGVTLFIRTRKGMLLTPEGITLYRHCQDVLRLEYEALPLIQQTSQTRFMQVSLSGPSSLMRSRITPAIIKLITEVKNVTVNLDFDDSESLAQKLRQGRIDFIFLPRNEVPLEFESKILKPISFVLIGPATWKNRKMQDILTSERIIDFDSKDKTTHLYLKKFKFKDYRSERHLVNNNDALVEMIEAGLGYGVLAWDFYQEFVNKRKIILLNGQEKLEESLALCWMKRPVYPEIFSRIIKEAT